MAGRQQKVINEQAERYGFPFVGAVIDLRAVVRYLHDFLARNNYKLAAGETGDALLDGASQTLKDEYSRQQIAEKRERVKLLRIERLEREGASLSRDVVHEALGKIAGIIRSAGEQLQREYGDDARQILDEAITDADRITQDSFGTETESGSHHGEEKSSTPKKARPKKGAKKKGGSG